MPMCGWKHDVGPRRRAPLPPHSARFREARHVPAQESPAPPSTAPDGGRRAFADQPSRPLRDDDVPMRYVDVSTDPPFRRQGPSSVDEPDFDIRGRPPPVRLAEQSRPGSRFDQPMQGPRDYGREPMDIDRPSSLPPHRGFDGPPRPAPAMYIDQAGDVLGDAPRGPRAMAREPVTNAASLRPETQAPLPPPTTWGVGIPPVPRGGQRPPPRSTIEVVHALILVLQHPFSCLLPRSSRTLRSYPFSVPRPTSPCRAPTPFQ